MPWRMIDCRPERREGPVSLTGQCNAHSLHGESQSLYKSPSRVVADVEVVRRD